MFFTQLTQVSYVIYSADSGELCFYSADSGDFCFLLS